MSMSAMGQEEGRTVTELESPGGGVCCDHFPNKSKGPCRQTSSCTQIDLSSISYEQKIVTRRRRKRARAEGVEMKKRRLSEEQVRYLEMSFRKERKLESGRKAQLATDLGIDPKQVAVWFQNRRARSKSKQLEEEYSKLRTQLESTVLHKCQLETEILHLKEELSKAREEVRKLSGAPDVSCGGGGNIGGGEMSSSSPSTVSFSMDNTNQGFHGSMIEPEGEELVYMNEYNTYVNMLDLTNL